MTTIEPTADESTDLKPRDARALTEYMSVLEDVGRVRGAADLYLVVSQSGKEYLVDARSGTCECPDHQRRGAHCKHARRVAFATGERAIPAWVDADAVDPNLADCVAATPRVVATDGGQLLDESENDAGDDRPDDCECWDADAGLCCWPCFRSGFETPNPKAPSADK